MNKIPSIQRLLLLLPIVALFTGCGDSRMETHLPDERLIANFRAHRATFEKLREMILQDTGLVRIRNVWYDPADLRRMGVESERIGEYRRLFELAGVFGGFYSLPARQEIELITSSHVWFDHGSDKGYLYSETPPEGLLQNRFVLLPWDREDSGSVAPPALIGRAEPGRRIARHIEGNWYLFYWLM